MTTDAEPSRVLTITLNPAIDLSIALGRLQPGCVQRAVASQATPAGKANNVARVLAAHGHRVTASGFLGAANAAIFEAGFAEWGVQDAFVRVAGETRTNVKLSEADGRVTDINAAGPTISADDWQQLEQTIDRLLADGLAAVVIAGSLPPGVAPQQLSALAARLRACDVPVWIDTSGAALADVVATRPFAIKPNDEELAELVGTPVLDIHACRRAGERLCSTGIDHVFVSRGAAGLLWCRRDGEALSARPPAVNIVSTVCAGDTLLAGLLHGHLAGWPALDILRFATALSADAVRRIGVGRSDTADFEALCEQVEITPLAPMKTPAAATAAKAGDASSGYTP